MQVHHLKIAFDQHKIWCNMLSQNGITKQGLICKFIAGKKKTHGFKMTFANSPLNGAIFWLKMAHSIRV